MAHTVKRAEIFFYLFFLTGFFSCLEISFFLQCNGTYLSDFTLVAGTLHIPASILPGIIYFLFAQFLIHFLYCFIIWMIALSISYLLRLSLNKQIKLAIFIWILGIFTALVANQFFFPNSKFAELTAVILFSPMIIQTVLLILCVSFAWLILLALLGLIKKIFQHKHLIIAFGFSIVLVSGYVYFHRGSTLQIQDASTETQPNIIIIGVDAVRPDFLGYFNGDRSTPFFDDFFNHSTVFSEAVTPLARTFPSWSSILTGEYPRELGLRSDLAKQTGINLSQSLPNILRQRGYQTIYATDETRFSNLDKNFGFDHLITPPIGLNDFLLGTFNDFPLSNLIINTTVGKWLFPHSYANRPVHVTYNPNSFLDLLRPNILAPRTKPLFLAIHFCLPHSPYLWQNLAGNQETYLQHYAASIVRVDQQLQDFYELLQQSHLLDHAIVVLLSDHGEGLELNGDRITEANLFIGRKEGLTVPKFYPPSLDKEDINQSAGHGTDVLGLTQYHSLLAFRLYGIHRQQVGNISGRVSLLAIQPTILQLLGFPYRGKSLVDNLTGKRKDAPSAPIFLESDFTPEAIRTVYPETRKVLLEGIQIFEVDPLTTRLTVKNVMSKMIINSKQYAVLEGDWILALYPQGKNIRMPILVNLVDGEWTNDLHSPFAIKSPAIHMLQELKGFYGNEVGIVPVAY